MERDVYVIDGLRTPFIKAAGVPNLLSAADLAVSAINPLLLRQNFAAPDITEVVAGCVAPSAAELNIAKIIALRVGCGNDTVAWTVQRNCASGLEAIDGGYKSIKLGRHDLVLVGGTEAMSRSPVLFSDEFVLWMQQMQGAKTWKDKLKQIIKFRPKILRPVIGLLKGLTDPVVNLSMGQTAEILAYEYNISRSEMDEFALRSQQRAFTATEEDRLSAEITPIFDYKNRAFNYDNGIRGDVQLEKLSKLRPVFDKPYGKITAGNSSQITDGAAFLILASANAVKKFNLQPQAKINGISWAAVAPERMGLGPVYAIDKLLKQSKQSFEKVDYWEINEAFAGQVLACLRDMEKDIGKIDSDRINVDGGAIALGHPVGASGARLALHMMHILKRQQAAKGVISLCIGGGQGGALLIENLTEE